MAILDLQLPEHAYMFGFLQTDGHHSANSRNRGTVTVEVSAIDDAILHAFRSLLLPINSRVTYRNRVTNFGPNSSAVWTVCDWTLRKELLALGLPIGRKSDDVSPPSGRFSSRDYLRGLVDGDGSIGFTGTGRPFVAFVTRSSALSEFFCQQVKTVTGAERSANRNTRDGVYNLLVTSDPAAILAGWLYPEGCLALKRKRTSAEAVAAWKRPAKMRARPASKRLWTARDDEVVLANTIRGAAEILDRTPTAVNMRRWRLRNSA